MEKIMKKLTVGLVSSGQLSFPGDKEAQFKRSVNEMQNFAKSLNFDLWVYKKHIITESDAEEAANAIQANNIDFLMLQCTSFSAGFLAPVFAKLYKRCGTRLGLWAIEESMDGMNNVEDGAMPLNSLCSINMYAGIIGHYVDNTLPFKWFFGNAGQTFLDDRFSVTVRVLTAIKNLNNSKVALVGGIAPGFNDLYFDERTLLRRFDGLRYDRLHEIREITDRAKAISDIELSTEMNRQKSLSIKASDAASVMLETNTRVYLAFRDFLQDNDYDALAISCWPHFQQVFDKPFSACDVLARLNETGVVAACEGDPISAVSMLMLKYISDSTSMLMDLSAFDEKDETILMWHCGPAAACFAGKSGYSLDGNYSGMPHEKGKPPKCIGITRDMVFNEGPVTIARLTGENDMMFLAGGTFIKYTKKSFSGSRGWMGSLTLNRKDISVRDFINTILVKKFQHHFPIVKGDYSREVLELCAWLGLKSLEKVEYQDYLQI